MIAAFWLVVISPKRDEAASLKDDIDGLQLVAGGRRSRRPPPASRPATDFRINYRRLVVLGKAVPADGDQAGLLVQLQRLADRSGVEVPGDRSLVQRARAPPRRRLPPPRLSGVADTAGHALDRHRRGGRHPGRLPFDRARHRSGGRDAADRRLGGPGRSAGDALRPQVHRRLLRDRELPGEPRRDGSDAARRGRRHRPPADGGRIRARPPSRARVERASARLPTLTASSRRHHLPHPRRPGDHGRRDPERSGARYAGTVTPTPTSSTTTTPSTAPTSSAPAPTP